MNCQDFLRRIEDDLLTRPEAAVESLRAHLEECEQTACRELLEETLVVDQAVSAWRQQTPAVDVSDAVLTQWRTLSTVSGRTLSPLSNAPPASGSPIDAPPALQRAPSAPAAPAQAGRAWSVVLAVALLMMTLPLLVPDRSDEKGNDAGPVVAAVERKHSIEQSQSAPPPAAEGPHTEIVRDRSIAYYNAAQHATRMVTDAVVLVLPEDDPAGQFEDPTHVPEWVGRWEEQIEPLRSQFDSAVRSLMDVLPEPMPAT